MKCGHNIRKYTKNSQQSPKLKSMGRRSVDTQESDVGNAKSESLRQVLQRLRSKVSAKGMREKIKINRDDQVIYTF